MTVLCVCVRARTRCCVTTLSLCKLQASGTRRLCSKCCFWLSRGPSLPRSLPTAEFPADSGDAFDAPSPTDVPSSAGLPGAAEEDQQDQERSEPPVPSGEDKKEL